MSGVEAPTPEQDAETATLETEYNRLEVRERAAIISETDNGDTPTPSDTGADAELRSIQERADLGNYFASIVDETPLLGAELGTETALWRRCGQLPAGDA